MRKAKPGLIDRGHGVLVRFGTGALANASENAVLHGANLVAIGNGSPYGWEIFQFTRASLVASNLWSLGERLRGQFGTDATMPDEWPVGSIVVVLDGALRQLALDPATLGQVRHWRIGPAMRGVDHPSYRQRATNTPGAGLRPLSPCHLRLVGERLSWIRRTRIQGDRWDLRDVPLAEAREAYLILVEAGGETHEFESGAAAFDLPSGLAGQAGQGRLTASVAQLSEQFGPGPFITRSF